MGRFRRRASREGPPRAPHRAERDAHNLSHADILLDNANEHADADPLASTETDSDALQTRCAASTSPKG